MAHNKIVLQDNFKIDLFKLKCYAKRKGLTLDSLSKSLSKSKNWLYKKSENGVVINVSVAMLIADKLGCTIQDFKYYAPYRGNDDSEECNFEKNNDIVEFILNNQKQPQKPLSPDMEQRIEQLISRTIATSEDDKDFYMPFSTDYDKWIKSSIDKMDALDKRVVGPFLDKLVWTDSDIKAQMILFLMNTIDSIHHMGNLNNDKTDNSDSLNMEFSHGKWWINLFLSKLREEIFRKDAHVHIPNETELRRIYEGHSTKQPSKKEGTDLKKYITKNIDKIIEAVVDDATAQERIASACADYLSKYFHANDDTSEMRNSLYKKGFFESLP